MSADTQTNHTKKVGGDYHVVVAGESGLRLDRWFRTRYPGLGHARLSKLLRQGQIRLDGARVPGSARLEVGQKIRVPPLPSSAITPRLAPQEVSAADAAFVEGLLLHRDESVLALNKPPGLAVQGGSGLRRHLDGMLGGLCFGREDSPRLTHRLDRDVSGVLVLGRSSGAAAHLCESFRERRVGKLYWALTLGVPTHPKGRIETSMEKESNNGVEKMTLGKGKKACTDYVVVESVGTHFTWIGFVPQSGRTHQLRVHAAALGCPILGDGKYGGREARVAGEEMGLASGLHLHAARLRLPHPDGGILDVSASPPSHMEESWSTLGLDWRTGGGIEDSIWASKI